MSVKKSAINLNPCPHLQTKAQDMKCYMLRQKITKKDAMQNCAEHHTVFPGQTHAFDFRPNNSSKRNFLINCIPWTSAKGSWRPWSRNWNLAFCSFSSICHFLLRRLLAKWDNISKAEKETENLFGLWSTTNLRLAGAFVKSWPFYCVEF